jgi:hypothetical protein
MNALEPLAATAATPTTNRGVYPHSRWSESALDYYRATVGASVEVILSTLTDQLGRVVTRQDGPAVRHYGSHVQLVDQRGRAVVSVFWGGQNGRPNVEAKGSFAPAVAHVLRSNWEHFPSRGDVKRDATAPDLFQEIKTLMCVYADTRGLALSEITNRNPDYGDTVYLGSRASQAFIRVYQPGLKRAQEEGRTGDDISTDEREAVRVELQFNPQKRRAKHAAATLSPDQLWGVSPWIADFASEVFAMNVQPITISERRESNRNRALRFMATQYQAHLADLLAECQGDVSLFGATILDLADIPHTH